MPCGGPLLARYGMSGCGVSNGVAERTRMQVRIDCETRMQGGRFAESRYRC
jgi:hypothetical protein